MESNLSNQNLVLLIITVLTKRLGGTVRIEQKDIDEVAFSGLEETGFEDGTVEFKFHERTKVS